MSRPRLPRLVVLAALVELRRVNLLIVVRLEPKLTLVRRELIPTPSAVLKSSSASPSTATVNSTLERVVLEPSPGLKLTPLTDGSAKAVVGDVNVGAERVRLLVLPRRGWSLYVLRCGCGSVLRGGRVEGEVGRVDFEEVAPIDEQGRLGNGVGGVLVEVDGLAESEGEVLVGRSGGGEDTLDADPSLESRGDGLTLVEGR